MEIKNDSLLNVIVRDRKMSLSFQERVLEEIPRRTKIRHQPLTIEELVYPDLYHLSSKDQEYLSILFSLYEIEHGNEKMKVDHSV